MACCGKRGDGLVGRVFVFVPSEAMVLEALRVRCPEHFNALMQKRLEAKE